MVCPSLQLFLSPLFIPAIVGLVLERTLYKRLYGRTHLDHVLFSIGIVFMAVAAVDYTMGSQQQLIQLPRWLQGRVDLFGVQVGLYRSFIICVCGILVVALQLVLTKTRFGSRLRAAVDDPRVARGLGINVSVIFADNFCCRLRDRGAGWSARRGNSGLDPTFPLKFMIYFLIVVTVGGTTSISGPFLASLMLGIADVAGKYYVPSFGAFVIYTLMIIVLILRPQGLFARAR